jgi:drug/metabolite transporter (DMT)-like permease
MNKPSIKAYIAWINICIVWGTTYLAIRIGVADMPPMLFAGLRWIIAGTGISSFFLLKNVKFPSFNDSYKIALAGIAMLGAGNGLVVIAEQWISSGLAALLITTTPFWMVGLESLLPGNSKLNSTIITGLVLGLIGVVIIFSDDFKYLFELQNLIGIICLLLAVIFWSAGTIYSKLKSVKTQPLIGASIQMLTAGTLQILIGISIGEVSQFRLTQDSVLALIYLITIGSVIGYGSYIYAINHLPLSLVSTYAYINPLIALFLGWLILDEKLSWNIILSAVLILAAVMLVQKGSTMLKADSNKKSR